VKDQQIGITNYAERIGGIKWVFQNMQMKKALRSPERDWPTFKRSQYSIKRLTNLVKKKNA
jgi:hypothetical protein